MPGGYQLPLNKNKKETNKKKKAKDEELLREYFNGFQLPRIQMQKLDSKEESTNRSSMSHVSQGVNLLCREGNCQPGHWMKYFLLWLADIYLAHQKIRS